MLLHETYESFRRVYGWVLAGVSVIAGVVSIALQLTEKKVSAVWLVVLGAVLLVAVPTIVDLVVRLSRRASQPLPKVRAGARPPPLYRRAEALLLLDPSDLYGQGAVVSVFCQSDEFEELVGLGYVTTVQANGRVQVLVSQSFAADGTLWDGVRSNNGSVLNRLMVKPSVPHHILLTDGSDDDGQAEGT